MTHQSNRVVPFLAVRAVPRTGDPQLSGRYCPALDVWVVETVSGESPLVRMSLLHGETTTVTTTAVAAEADDTDLSPGLMASTSTFTKISAEGDDTDFSHAGLLEVTTKTNAQVERDDVATRIAAMDPRESDDLARTVSPIH